MEILCKGGKNPCYSDSVVRWDKELLPIKNNCTFSPSLVSTHRPHIKNPYRLGNTSHENTPPCNSGGFALKGYEMKKYIPVDFDEKGNAVLGRAKNTPTSNGFIPTTWTPGGGGDEGKQGLKSISISPAITTTPALDSLFPIYWEDLTEEQKDQGISIVVDASGELGEDFSYTITPTGDWYAVCTTVNPPIMGEKGAPIVVTGEYSVGLSFANGLDPEAADFKAFDVRFKIFVAD